MKLKWIGRLFATFSTLVAMAGVGAYWAHQQVLMYGQTPLTNAENAEFNLASGRHVRQVIQDLAAQGYLEYDDYRVRGLLKLQPELAQIRAGFYHLPAGQSLVETLQQFKQGAVAQFPITLIEGKTIVQWQAELAEQKHLQFSPELFQQILDEQGDQDLAEGKFFPNTYHYEAGQSAKSFLTQSYLAMQSALAEVWAGRDPSVPLKSPYELLILASIIEKETGAAHERPMVAAVFANRLKQGMRLQTDPTVIYGMGERFQGNITKKDLREHTPYNTYRINGLPPSPIAAPSLASLQAAAHPADVDYVYFVSRNDGTHVFSKTLAEHNRAVNEYQRKRTQ